MKSNAYLGLGGNIGKPVAAFKAALSLISDFASVISVSRLYRSTPFGYAEQPSFINAAAHLTTELKPIELLDALQKVEQDLGKRKVFENGPRAIDLDLLLFEQLVIKTERLVLPHPAILERDFVLRPLSDIDPGLTNPAWLGKTLEWALTNLQKKFITEEPEEWEYLK